MTISDTPFPPKKRTMLLTKQIFTSVTSLQEESWRFCACIGCATPFLFVLHLACSCLGADNIQYEVGLPSWFLMMGSMKRIARWRMVWWMMDSLEVSRKKIFLFSLNAISNILSSRWAPLRLKEMPCMLTKLRWRLRWCLEAGNLLWLTQVRDTGLVKS